MCHDAGNSPWRNMLVRRSVTDSVQVRHYFHGFFSEYICLSNGLNLIYCMPIHPYHGSTVPDRYISLIFCLYNVRFSDKRCIDRYLVSCYLSLHLSVTQCPSLLASHNPTCFIIIVIIYSGHRGRQPWLSVSIILLKIYVSKKYCIECIVYCRSFWK